jgi:hypothetical protein
LTLYFYSFISIAPSPDRGKSLNWRFWGEYLKDLSFEQSEVQNKWFGGFRAEFGIMQVTVQEHVAKKWQQFFAPNMR